jgi:hypothetical protein
MHYGMRAIGIITIWRHAPWIHKLLFIFVETKRRLEKFINNALWNEGNSLAQGVSSFSYIFTFKRDGKFLEPRSMSVGQCTRVGFSHCTFI